MSEIPILSKNMRGSLAPAKVSLWLIDQPGEPRTCDCDKACRAVAHATGKVDRPAALNSEAYCRLPAPVG
jgi:hypothetical protein